MLQTSRGIVHDNATNVKILQTRFLADGCQVITALESEEGLAAGRDQLPDLALLDVMLPVPDGFVVCQRLAADAVFPFIPIIMVPAMADSKDAIAGLEAGGDEYLAMPIGDAKLPARLRSMPRMRRLYNEAQTLASEVKEWNASLKPRVATS